MYSYSNIKKYSGQTLLIGIVSILVCFFSCRPLVSWVQTSLNEDYERCEDTQQEDDSEEENEVEKEWDEKLSSNNYDGVTSIYPMDDLNPILNLLSSHYTTQHLEIPIRPPRFFA